MLALAALALLAACDASEAEGDPLGLDGGATTADGGDAINREAILGNLTEVQTLLDGAASSFNSAVITDVEYDSGQLTVTVSQDVQAAEDAQQLCADLAGAVASVDLSIVVRDETGTEQAACTFQG